MNKKKKFKEKKVQLNIISYCSSATVSVNKRRKTIHLLLCKENIFFRFILLYSQFAGRLQTERKYWNKIFVCESLSKLKSTSEKRFLKNVELIYILKAFLLPIFTQTFVSKRVLSFG